MYSNYSLFIITFLCTLLLSNTLNGQEASFDASKELQEIQALLISESEMDTIVSKVLKSSYQLKRTEEQIAGFEQEKKIAGKNWMRSFTVGVNMFGYNVVPSSLDNTNTTQFSVLSNASVTLLISPYDLFTQKNRNKRAQYRINEQEMLYEDIRRNAKIYIINKFLDYQAALEAYILNENNLMISNELKHVADQEFKRGTISNAEYNQILAGVMRNRMDLLGSENAVMKLKFEIEILMKD